MKAANILNQWWDGILPIDILALCRYLDVKLIPSNDIDYLGYFISKYDPSNPWGSVDVIQFNTNESINRQRFTIAHELGHLTLGHTWSPRDYLANFSSSTIEKFEKEANDFAIDLLIPRNAVRHLVGNGHTSIDELATIFMVSTAAMGYGLQRINLLGL